MLRTTAILLALSATLVAGLAAQGAAPPPPINPAIAQTGGSITLDTQTRQKIKVTAIATGLVHPWSVAFPDARTILVTEQPGRLRVIRDGVLLPEPAWDAMPPPNNADGLHFVALHPRYAENHLVYLSYPRYGSKGVTLGISRGELDGTSLKNVKEIFVADAWETGGNLAGRIYFAPDGMLLATVGDRDRICCNAEQKRADGSDDNRLRLKAQDLGTDVGKTLRLKDDGTVPPDNPFVNRSGARPEIYTYGHRNGYGLMVNPADGNVWEAEIGPLGGDEVNVLLPGHNYGWPLVSMGRNYTGSLVSDEPWFRQGMDNPRMFWVPSISPSSLMFYAGDRFKGWNGSMFIGALTTRVLLRVSFNQPSQAERREPLLATLNVRIRDIALGPDGNLYVATEQASGGRGADGTLLKIEPVE
jgi:glucose/arabinose dehydrogenase